MTKTHITIATRESPLALWQANWVKQALQKKHPDLQISLLGMTTQADQMLSLNLAEVGGKGLFVKELEQALLEHRADIAVHSMKDMPMDLPEGLSLPVMCERFDPRDVFLSNHYKNLQSLPENSIVGTSSLRRQSQLKALRPNVIVQSLRGNVNTRIDKLDEGKFSAIILAAAGVKRLGLEHRITAYLSLEESLPAVGQGVLGIECRTEDAHIQKYIQSIHDPNTFLCVTAERAMCKKLGGGCQLPIAAYAEIRDNQLWLRGLVGSLDGKIILRASKVAPLHEAEQLGLTVAESLLQQGAGKILNK